MLRSLTAAVALALLVTVLEALDAATWAVALPIAGMMVALVAALWAER